MSNSNTTKNEDKSDLIKDATNNACVFKPEDIAEKLDVPATRIGVYARSFEELLIGHMELTKGKHRRFSSTGVKILMELHLLIKGSGDKPGLSYELAREEMARRLKNEGSIGETLLPYEANVKMNELSVNDKELYTQFVLLREDYQKMLDKMDTVLRYREDDRLELREKFEQQIEEIKIVSKHEAEKTQALHTLYLLKSQGKPSFFARLFGLRNIEKENEVIKYCEEIIGREDPLIPKRNFRKITEGDNNNV